MQIYYIKIWKREITRISKDLFMALKKLLITKTSKPQYIRDR